MSDIREQLFNKNSLGQCETQNVVWIAKEKINTPPKQLQGRGEIPYQFEQYNNSSSGSSHSSFSNRKHFKHKKGNSQKKMFPSPNNQNRFSHIGSNVREVTGGRNTQSNEAIERRHRERQLKYVEEKTEQNINNSCNINSSSGSSESYKTTLQDSYELKVARNNSEQETSETLSRDTNLQRYKKNALMLGLLRNADYSDLEKEDTPTESSGEYYDTSSFDDMASGMTNLNIDENELQSERIGRFFQSQEDEDVYFHPLKEQIQKDPEWQKLTLKRKGIEITQSPRQYFLNVPDEAFDFQARKPK